MRVERQHQRAGRVVDDQRVLGAGERGAAARGNGRRGCRACRCGGRTRGCCSRPRWRSWPRTARAASGARPRLVCSTTPGGVEHGPEAGPARSRHALADLGAPSRRAGPRAGCARPRATRGPRRPPTARGAAPSRAATSGSRRSRSTEGSVRRRSLTALLDGAPFERVGRRLGLAVRLEWSGRVPPCCRGRRLGYGQDSPRTSPVTPLTLRTPAQLHLVLALGLPRLRHPEHQLIGERRPGGERLVLAAARPARRPGADLRSARGVRGRSLRRGIRAAVVSRAVASGRPARHAGCRPPAWEGATTP